MTEDKKYTRCPFCDQIARREEIEKGTHVCWGPKDNTHKTLGVWDY